MKAGVLITKEDTVECKEMETRDQERPLIAVMENKQTKTIQNPIKPSTN